MNEYYNENRIQKIVKLFVDNNVKLEFSKLDELLVAFEKVEQFLVTEKLNHLFEQYKQQCLVELDVFNQKILSIGESYPYYIAHLCKYKQVKQHLNILTNLFSDAPVCIFGIFDNFVLMYSGENENKLEGIYYSLNEKVCFDLSKECFVEILQFFNLNDSNIKFLQSMPENIFLTYVGFDTQETLVKFAFVTQIKNFLDGKVSDDLNDYVKMQDILSIVRSFFSLDDGISIQYDSTNQEYFALEVSMKTDKLKQFSDLLYKNEIITEQEYKNYCDLSLPPEFINSVFKFRWQNNSVMNLKLYVEKQL